MKRLTRKAMDRITRRNAVWFLKTNVQSWILQGAMVGLLAIAGVGTVAAMVSAKVTAYVVFVGQCVQKARVQ